MVDVTKDQKKPETEKAADQTVKKEETDDVDMAAQRPSYEELLPMMNVISKPLASKKMTKKIYKLVKKCAKAKKLTRGVKQVAKSIRKKEKGVVIFAGDVSPLDVYSHLPLQCEENKLPYCFVPARFDLGLASQTKRATCVVMLQKHDDYLESYNEVKETVKAMPLPL